jgi:cyclopropane fatty-acyl-phospholipid synthase-like methyltransferase
LVSVEQVMGKYIKEVFNSKTLEQAKNTCLTFDPSDPNKFENETRFLVDFLKQNELLNKDSLVLDYGCGVGRISKMIIDDIGCRIAGVDISAVSYTHLTLPTSP